MKTALSVLMILIPALVFGCLRAPAEMGLAIVAGGLAAAFLNIDKIKRVKGAGFEAKMRKVVEEAQLVTKDLRRVARPLIETTLHILTMEGRIGGMDPKHKHDFRAELERLGRRLGIADDQAVRSAHDFFFRYHTWDHFSEFADHVWHPEAVPEVTRNRLMEMRKYESNAHPSREEIEAVLGNDIDKLQSTDIERLEDYVYYKEQHALRRPEALSKT